MSEDRKVELTDKIEQLSLPVRVYNAIKKRTNSNFWPIAIETVNDLLQLTTKHLLSFRGVGARQLYLTQCTLYKHGYFLKGDVGFIPKPEKEQVYEAIKTVLDTFSTLQESYDNFDYLRDRFSVYGLCKELLAEYISVTEGGCCSVDKASFIAMRLQQALNKGEHLPLTETYADYAARHPNDSAAQSLAKASPNKVCYWCPELLKDTRQAMLIIDEAPDLFNQCRSLLSRIVAVEAENKELRARIARNESAQPAASNKGNANEE